LAEENRSDLRANISLSKLGALVFFTTEDGQLAQLRRGALGRAAIKINGPPSGNRESAIHLERCFNQPLHFRINLIPKKLFELRLINAFHKFFPTDLSP